MNGTMGLRSSMQTSIEAEGTMGLYFRTAPMLVTMRSIPLLDAELDIGAEAEATRTGRPNGQICSDVNVKCPVFIIGVGDESVKYKNKKSLLCTMDISKSCEFTSFARSKSLHYERLADGTKQFVKECTYNEQPEDDKPKGSEASAEAPTQEQPTRGAGNTRNRCKKNQGRFIHIKREWQNISRSRRHFILTIRIIGQLLRKGSAMMGSTLYYRMKMGQKCVTMQDHI